MITFEMLTAAIYSLVGLAALVTAVTQIFKNLWSKADKKWVNHLLSFIASIICCGAVLFIGANWGIGVFAAFCFACLDSWLMFIGTVIGCALIANGLWTYDYMQKVLEWINLLPKNTKPENK